MRRSESPAVVLCRQRDPDLSGQPPHRGAEAYPIRSRSAFTKRTTSSAGSCTPADVSAPASLLRTDRVEGRFLLVGQRSIEVIHRHAHGLHRLQHGVEPLANGCEACRRRPRVLRPGLTRCLQRVRGPGGGALKPAKISALLVGRPDRLLDCGGPPPRQLRLRHIAGWSGRGRPLPGPGRAPARGGKRIDLRLLLLPYEAVETI